MRVLAFSVSFVIQPLAFVDVAIGVDEFALAVCFVVLPVSFISRTIWPHLASVAVSETVRPLTSIDGAIFESNRTASYSTFLINYLTFLKGVLSVVTGGSKVDIVCFIVSLLEFMVHVFETT
jgi:hypothetical protein